MSQTITVNGDAREFGEAGFPATVLDLVKNLGLDPAMVVAEVNGGVIRREDFGGCSLAGGDSVELVRFVGGG